MVIAARSKTQILNIHLSPTMTLFGLVFDLFKGVLPACYAVNGSSGYILTICTGCARSVRRHCTDCAGHSTPPENAGIVQQKQSSNASRRLQPLSTLDCHLFLPHSPLPPPLRSRKSALHFPHPGAGNSHSVLEVPSPNWNI